MVSIVIPAYNAEKTIMNCLESIMRQTYSDVEILVIDDGSEDGTYRLALEEAAKDNRIRVFLQANAGVSAARNKGIEEAIGEYVTFIDSDDVISPRFIEVLLSHCQINTLPVVDLVRSDSMGSALMPIKTSIKIKGNISRDYLCGDLGQGISFSVGNKLFKRETLESKQIRFSENLKIGEDMLFVLHYLQYCDEIEISRDAAYYYNISDGSAMNTERDYTNAYEQLLKMLKAVVPYNILAEWALNASAIVVGNNYIRKMKLSSFWNWWRCFRQTELCCTAKKNDARVTIKKSVLQLFLKIDAVMCLWLLLKTTSKIRR
ncbi:MAG: glycosyltransferase family 2 protein [Anaerovoracaceae bacterium]